MERIPILQMGRFLLVTIQVDMHDRLAMNLQDDLTAKVHAGNLIKEIVAVVGGKGGGKPDKAEAGGSLPDKLADALELARKRVAEQLSK